MSLTDGELLALSSTLQDKVIAITGSTSGIGLSTAKILASHGARLSIAGRDPAKLAAAHDALVALAPSPDHVLATGLDVTDAPAVDAWIAATVARFGRLDAAVNAAGREMPRMAHLVDTDDATWEQTLAVNLTGVMYCMRAQLRVMGEGGAIVNVGSTLGSVGLEANAAYCAAKAGLLGLSRSVAREVGGGGDGRRGVRVNVVSPLMVLDSGFCDTPMLENATTVFGTAFPTLQLSVQKRVSKPHELAHPIIFLLSPLASFITGADYHVDGGWLC